MSRLIGPPTAPLGSIELEQSAAQMLIDSIFIAQLGRDFERRTNPTRVQKQSRSLFLSEFAKNGGNTVQYLLGFIR